MLTFPWIMMSWSPLRTPGLGYLILVPPLLATNACMTKGAHAETAASAAGATLAPPAPSPASEPGAAAGAELMAAMPTTAPSSPIEGDGRRADAPPATVPTREMLDIEGNVMLQVGSVQRAVKTLHDLAVRSGGVVTAERIDSSSRYGSAELTLRIPSRSTDSVFREFEKLGSILNQTVTARDVGKEFFDANLRLTSLNATLQRYEDVLSKATKVEEILRIEQELARVRTEIEQVKGNLRWLSDRTARATLHVTVREKPPEVVYSDEPEPKLYPGFRAPLLFDLGRAKDRLHFGGGVSIRFSRSFSLDLDVLRRGGSESRGPDAYLASGGGELYSDLLGDGERRFLNPYLGFRAGYGYFEGHDQVLLGGTAGVELFKNSWFDLDLETRHYLAFGGSLGAHYVLVPALGANIAF